MNLTYLPIYSDPLMFTFHSLELLYKEVLIYVQSRQIIAT